MSQNFTHSLHDIMGFWNWQWGNWGNGGAMRQWAMGNGAWAMGNELWAMGNGQGQ